MNDVVEIELQMKDAEEMIELEKALERLDKNRDFKRLIRQGYLTNEAVRLVQLKGAPGCQDPKTQAAILRDIDGIGSLLCFFHKVHHEADVARRVIEAGEQELELLRNEGADL